MAKIEIYTQPWCPYCARALNILNEKSGEVREINAPHGTAEREEAIKRSGGRTTVPQIFIDGAHIGGCDDLVALERAGKLDALLAA
ncbi:glutaredoxin 3 [Rhodovarius crocodyli]|uniref:Glutaredoxin n=1 Tax=Rhodovarius crocodyli TaxID=1979269 RepID=A0A437MLM0_9PROT|nr:glutaredoxin 3 [Rhodovarius crocodyli]RVT98558.1 glutaredoxin 3 [Rhodovarius crocodyli]